MRRLAVFLATSLLGLVVLQPAIATEADLRPACPATEAGEVQPDGSVAELAERLADPGQASGRCGIVAALAKLADGGDAVAAIVLGDAFASGRFLARDDQRALDYYLRSADLGDGQGFLKAGDLYGSTSPTPNPATANAYYADALAEGVLEGAVRLGEFMATSGNAELALEYFQQAAEGGLTDGLVHMAGLYESSALGRPDAARAEAIYRQAIAEGSQDAAVGLARLLTEQGKTDDAVELLAAAGDGGNAAALEALGDLQRDAAISNGSAAQVTQLYSRAAVLGRSSAALKLGDILRDAATPDVPAALEAYRLVPEEGQVRIGDMFRDGLGVEPDVEAAIAAYAAAFAAGSDVAAQRLGLMYLDGTLVARSIEKAATYLQYVPASIPADQLVPVGQALLVAGFGDGGVRRALDLFERAVASGDAAAAAQLGELYLKGAGVPRDLVAAERYFLQSPDGIPVSALMELADAHRDGNGMAADTKRAAELYELALAAGIPEAAMRLGEANAKPGAMQAAVTYYAKAAELGVSEAYLRLGDLHSGEFGPTDAVAAVAAYRAAIDAGHLEAAARLGDIYFDGALLPRDLGEAERAYALSPDGVPARAMLDLGLFYLSPDGAAPDADKAVDYLERALSSGDLQAATVLGETYAEGRLVPIDPDKADGYFAMSGAPVPAQSSLALGEAYRAGDNVTADGNKAAVYLEAALNAGLTPAALSLGKMYLDGDLVPSDPAQAMRYLEPVLSEVPDEWRVAIGDVYRDGSAGTVDGVAARREYERALSANIPGAALRLANLLFDSGLVPQDIGRAAELWESTVEGVPERALMAVADYYRDRGDAPDKVINYYQAALAIGDLRAAGRLADIFYDGALVARDLGQAEHYYEAAGDGMPPDKLMAFAKAYEDGEGIAQDGARAAGYYEAALAAGQTEALQPLGQLYYDGKLVPQDLLRAADLLDQTGPGLPATQLRTLGDAFLQGAGVPTDPRRGVSYLEKALGAGDRTVLVRLGELYLAGQGVPPNPATAAHYLLGAAREGEAQPFFSMVEKNLDGTLTGGSVDRAEGLLRQAIAADIPGAALRLSEVLIDNGDAAGGVVILEAALAGGDADAGKRLLTHYLDGVGDVAPQVEEANRVLALVATALDPEEAAYADVMVAGRLPNAAGARERMAESFGQLSPARQSQALLALKRGNENVYVYLLQSILVAHGYMDAAPSGQLTGPTIRAVLALCGDIGDEATCAAGPLSDASAEVLASGLASGLELRTE